jgi:hypothetical protein
MMQDNLRLLLLTNSKRSKYSLLNIALAHLPKDKLFSNGALGPCNAYPARSHGFIWRSTARPSNARDGYSEIYAQFLSRALTHLTHHFFTYRPFIYNRIVVHTEQSFLDIVGIGHHGTFKIGR